MESVDISHSQAPLLRKTSRPPSEVAYHYRIEIELAERLRSAPRSERLGLYGQLYNELFRRFPAHPQLSRKVSESEQRKAVAQRIDLLRRFVTPDTVFLEIGAGDGSLTKEVAKTAKLSYALDVSSEILGGVRYPRVKTVLSDGCSVPVPAGSITLAFSDQVMEHIHPDDAVEQLYNLFAAVAPGGSFVCITPNRLNGPHDVSKFYDDVARGFHLKEYTVTELEKLFLRVGFRAIQAYPRFGKFYCRVPLALVKGWERILEILPARLKSRLGRAPVIRNLISSPLRAIK